MLDSGSSPSASRTAPNILCRLVRAKKSPIVSNALPLTIPLDIPAYWTPEQAFAVVELLDDLRDRIWAHYGVQLIDQYREQYGPTDSDHPDETTDNPSF